MFRFSVMKSDLMPGVGPPDTRSDKSIEKKMDWGNSDGGTVHVEFGQHGWTGKTVSMLVTVEELIRHLARRGNSLMRNKAWWAK